MTRLTVLFDPGRVKTGLRAHNQWGRALIEGENYKLVIDKAWLNLHGNPLETSFEKHFTVSRAQTSALSIEDWHITPPKMQTRSPLSVQFPYPLDHALLHLFIKVRKQDGQELLGNVDVTKEETLWNFIPTEDWQTGVYTLEIDGRLEDVAGNNLWWFLFTRHFFGLK